MISYVAIVGLAIFLFAISIVAIGHTSHLFLSAHGWSHRLFGGCNLLWLIFGTYLCCNAIHYSQIITQRSWFLYDVVLGILSTTATLTAARDFPHRLVKNADGQSGTLHRKAIVTQAEMIEHSFYQILNLWQALCLHAAASDLASQVQGASLLILWFACAPWLFRHRFPIHPFSGNWRKDATAKEAGSNKQSQEIEAMLYRIKKAQYLFYKHVILHGVNISVAISNPARAAIPYGMPWRVLWLSLNTSYVMEFFLQTLVKRSIMSQNSMLLFQRWLMLMATLSAVMVLQHLSVGACIISAILNFTNRRHDVFNTVAIGTFMMVVGHSVPFSSN